jgi:nicotinate-nucleotide adenylyltransferase
MTGSRTLRLYYGGTFDPVHEGHLATARTARDALDCPVRLMPAADPPHRAPPGADAAHRAGMLQLAVAGEPGLCVDLRELQRDGPSYTVDTLRGLRAEHGDAVPIALLIGADSLLGLPMWREWRALFELAHFIVADRPGNHLGTIPSGPLADAIAGRWTQWPTDLQATPGGLLYRLRQPRHPGSASQVRRRIAAGDSWEALVPAPVAAYIRAHGLYGASLHGPPTPPPL